MSWDHPRVCGEKAECSSKTSYKRGSPPRMRGKAHGSPCKALHAGITPAYAGKSAWQDQAGGGTQDHPRVCGEKWSPRYGAWQRQGSPPRMRGKAIAARRQPLGIRITPAYAGKSVPPTRS